MTAGCACKEVSQQLSYGHCVHLILQIGGEWEHDREAMVEELERRREAAEQYAQSALFRKQFGRRVAVLRVQAAGVAPSIVEYLLAERGIEIENLQEEPHPDGPSCVDCGRQHLSDVQAVMSARGWVCPSCHRARRLWLLPRLTVDPGLFQVPARVLWPLLALISTLFFVGVGYELSNLGQINHALRPATSRTPPMPRTLRVPMTLLPFSRREK